MGGILSKTTTENTETLSAMPPVSASSTPNKLLDPRSPNMYRTPISDLPFKHSKQISKAQDLTNDDNISTSITTTPTKLKTKLLQDLGYTLDPRSPAVNFDRTPLNFTEDPNMTEDLSFTNLSQSQSDFNTPIKESTGEMSSSETFITPNLDKIKLREAEIDPRSPSIDIERTPLDLNVIKEQIEYVISSESNIVEDNAQATITPKNDFVVGTENAKNSIYMDDENPTHLITPNQKTDKNEKTENQRTPLSCLVNTQVRYTGREKMNNRTSLARSILKDSVLSTNQNSNKMTNSTSKIPVFQKSNSK